MRIALLLTATVVGALFANPSIAGSLDVASADAAKSLPPPTPAVTTRNGWFG